MAGPCIEYKGKQYSYAEFATLLHDGELANLVNDGILKGFENIPEELKSNNRQINKPNEIVVSQEIIDEIPNPSQITEEPARNVPELDIKIERGGVFSGEFLNDYDFLAEGSEHTVYRSKDGKTVIKIGEPHNSNETYQARVDDALAINNLLGDGSLEVIGTYRSPNGTINPVYRQNFMDGKIATQEQVAEHLINRGFTQTGKDTFTINKDGKILEISDTSDNFIINDNGEIIAIDASIREIQNETTSSTNNPTNGNLSTRTSDVGESGTAKQESTAKESVQYANDVRSTKEKTKITQEPTLEDIANFLNENFNKNESDNGTKTESVQESSALGKKQKPKKPSQRGRTPLDKRKIKDKEVVSALRAEVFDAYSLAQQYFIGGGRVLPSEIKKLFNSDAEAKVRIGYARTKEKKGATIDQIAHNLWEEFGRNLGLDTSDFKEAVEQVISEHISTKSMAVDLNKRHGLSFEEGEFDNNDYYEQAKAMGLVNQNDHNEAMSYIDVMTDEELIQLADEQTSFEEFLANEENKPSEETKKLSDKVRSLKIDLGKMSGGGLQSNPLGLPVAVWNTSMDIIAKSIDAGVEIGEAIKRGLNYIQKNHRGQWNKKQFNDEVLKELGVRGIEINGQDVIVKPQSKEDAKVVDGFYSDIEKSLIDTKKDNLTASEWETIIGKSDEAKWTGLTDFINSKKGTISKAEIKDYLDNNRIEIVEIVKGKTSNFSEAELKDKINSRGYDLEFDMGGDGYMIMDSDGEFVEYDELPDDVKGWFDSLAEITNPEETTGQKYSEYQLEGESENYKEVLVTLPKKASKKSKRFKELLDKGFDNRTEEEQSEFVKLASEDLSSDDKSKEFQSSHFQEPNILVHLRMNTRTDANGKKVLFIEEIQSDWGQEGKKKGFAEAKKNKKTAIKNLEDAGYDVFTDRNGDTLIEKDEEIVDYNDIPDNLKEDFDIALSDNLDSEKTVGIPSAPFVTDTNSWAKLGVKVALKEAVKQGVDKIAWTTGEQQNERYDLSKQVDYISYAKNNDSTYDIAGYKDGKDVFYTDKVSEDKLSDTVGKEVADRIVNNVGENIEGDGTGYHRSLTGVQLSVGGKGMKGFYGSTKEGKLGIIGEVVKALTKQEPKTTKIDIGKEYLKSWDNAKAQGFKVIKKSEYKNASRYTEDFVIVNKDGDSVTSSDTEQNAIELFLKTSTLADVEQRKVVNQYSIDITPELKSEVEKGIPMFGNLKEQQKAMVNAEIDRIAQKVKDILPGIKDPDLKRQGISQDDLIDLVASAVKALVSKGIDINDAIRQVIASIKERFNVDVDEKLVKEKLGVEKPQDFESKAGKKSVLNRMASGNSSVIKKAIAKYSLDYEIENQKEAKLKAEMFVDEVGVDNALIAVRKGLIDGAQGAFIYARTIEVLEQQINDLKGDDKLDAIADYQELLGQISDELDNRSRSNGRFIAALAEIYNSSNGRYNLKKMVNDYKAANNGTISKEVLEKLKNVEEKLKESEAKLAELEAKKRVEEENEAFNNILEAVARKKRINTNAKISDKQKAKAFADKLRSFKISNNTNLSAATPFSIAYDLAIETAAKAIEVSGLVSDAIKAGVNSIRNSKLSKDEQEQALSDLFDLFDDSELSKNQKGIMSIDLEGKLRIPHSLIREKVENGIDNIDDLVSELMSDAQELFPDLDFTERQVRDIVTGYGKVSNPTTDEIETQISIMKSLGKIASGLEDAYKGQRPLRSGQQRREPTVKERTEMKKLKALLRDLPLADADIKKAYKTALEAIKKRLSNEIEELDEQIANGEKRKGQKSVIEYDQEAKDLKAERDAKKSILDEMVGKPELTEQQKIDRAEKTLQKRLDDLQQKIDNSEIDYAKKAESVTSAKLEEMRKLKKELESQIQKMREDSGLAEARLIDIAKRNASKRLAALKERIANGDFEKRKRKPTPTDVELNKIKSEIAQQKEIFDKEVYKLELKNRRIEQKALDVLKDILSIPKILSFTADLSFVGIQNVTQIYKMGANSLIHLAKTGKLKGTFRDAMAKTFKAMASPDFEQKFMQAVKANPNYQLWKDSRLGIVESHYKESAKAEVFQHNALSTLFDILGNYVASKGYEKAGDIIKNYVNIISIFERGQTVFENQMRINRFQEGVDLLKAQGLNPIDDIQEYRKVAAAVNTLTGRANTGSKVAAALREANGTLFSSFSNWAAGVNQLNPYWYYTLTPTARKMALTDVAHHIVGAGALISLAALYGLGQDDDDDDKVVVVPNPTSSDFAVIKVGNLRIDPWAGKKTTVVAISRFFKGGKTDKYGNFKKYGVEYDDEDWIDLPLEYAGNKIAPGPRFALERFFKTKEVEYQGSKFREDKYGTDFKASKYLIPLIFENFKEVNEEQPNLFGKAAMALSWTGLINTNVYGGMKEGFKDMPDDLIEKEYKVKIQKIKDNEKILESNIDKLAKEYNEKKITKNQILQKVDSLVNGDGELFNKSIKSIIEKVNKEELKTLVDDPFYLGLKKEKNPEIQAILFYSKFKDDSGMSYKEKKERDRNLRYIEFDAGNPRFIKAYRELLNSKKKPVN